MSFESRADREMEQSRRKKNEETVKYLESAAEHNVPSLDEFADSPEHQQDVAADKKYVEHTESRFDQDPSYHAKGLEHFIQFGIAQGRLLSGPEPDTYLAQPIWATRYDDLRNRIDAAATLCVFPGVAKNPEYCEITFAFDLTTNPDPNVIRRKLLIGTNDPSADLPAGFSQMKYYRDANGVRGTRPYVPRYCIGISSAYVDDLLDDTSVDSSGNVKIKPGAEAIPSFKILYEMSKQNELFQTALYRKDDLGLTSEDEQKALHDMEILDNLYLKELHRIAEHLPDWVKRGCQKPDGSYDIDAIAKKFMEGEDQDETFTAVVNTTAELLARFEDDSSYTDGYPDPDLLKKAGDRLRKTPAERSQNRGHALNRVAGRLAS